MLSAGYRTAEDATGRYLEWYVGDTDITMVSPGVVRSRSKAQIAVVGCRCLHEAVGRSTLKDMQRQ